MTDDEPVDIHIQIPPDTDYAGVVELEFMGASVYAVDKETWAICYTDEQYDYVQEILDGD